MKLSILTATYNRAKLISHVYESILRNLDAGIDIEWLIMDDGSTDGTEDVINKIRRESNLDIKYVKQVNQGKMVAINNLMEYVTGDVIVECDSDDYFIDNAFITIKKAYEESKYEKDLYGMCFLKYDKKGKNIGKEFSKKRNTMFNLYFKDLEDGEKSIVFFSRIRKKYKNEIEKGENFITEARMYHKMDLKYKIKCYNTPIMICDYQKNGYTKNIIKIFKSNPKGYFKYFREILTQQNMTGVPFSKRLYVIKHYILFSQLTKSKNILKEVKGFLNRTLIIFLYLPGVFATKMKFK